jgi:hypothetical protein
MSVFEVCVLKFLWSPARASAELVLGIWSFASRYLDSYKKSVSICVHPWLEFPRVRHSQNHARCRLSRRERFAR